MISCIPEALGASVATFRLPRVYRYDLSEALKQCGFTDVEADRAAQAAGGSCTILKRQLTVFSGQLQPAWTLVPHAQSVSAFLWIGGWTEKCDADREIVAEIGGKPYEEMLADAAALATMADPPTVHALGSWQLASKEDAWMRLGKLVTEDQLERFLQAATKVLGEDDPRFDLPADDRMYAESHGQTPRYSKFLHTTSPRHSRLLARRGRQSDCPTIGM